MTRSSPTPEPIVGRSPWTPSRGGVRLPVWAWIALWHVLGIGGSVALHYRLHGAVNAWHVALASFLVTNLLIGVWEIALYFRIGDLERAWAEKNIFKDPSDLFAIRASPREAMSTRLWSLIWLAYCRFDPSSADRKSFGFTIDVGNGFVTPVPTALFLVGMSTPILSPTVLGLMGIVLFYQKAYGTVLYFFQFLFNRRYVGHGRWELLGYVGFTNALWIVFPALGFVISVRLILERSFAFLWN